MSSPRSAFRLTVVIPTYNRRELVLRAISSVLEQAGSEFVQIVVADDGSTDGTVDAIGTRFGHDKRVQIVATLHRYACAARNAGFNAATGEFLCFLDSDDFWLPGTLATIADVFAAQPELAFVSVEGSTIETPGQIAIDRVVEHSPGWSHAEFRNVALNRSEWIDARGSTCRMLSGDFFPAVIHGDLFLLSGLVARRKAVLDAGPFNERFRFFNDWEFFARLCLQGPGAYLDFNGFRRDTGRADQISRGRPMIAMARRRRFILRSLAHRFPRQMAAYAAPLAVANDDANYFMARCLVRTRHRRWARRYLYRCLRRGYKAVRSSVLLAKSFTTVGISS